MSLYTVRKNTVNMAHFYIQSGKILKIVRCTAK